MGKELQDYNKQKIVFTERETKPQHRCQHLSRYHHCQRLLSAVTPIISCQQLHHHLSAVTPITPLSAVTLITTYMQISQFWIMLRMLGG